ncbi:MAG: bifunctional adenosylcobinamide kinase/adenosylcobinamide-phosphate guanylyltransferase [Clostridia bacterium]|jgi:adenosylcobinamide kinase/adenosylcobinamide-phosphate guanylyltransferase|nr:bifunctional adenosylcobinamide kinase/adenosylcobinamide-phosphate guanylyltransferase [Clostridia bacterium]
MTILITGGSKCGKSLIGEKLLSSWSLSKYYIATMLPYGVEAREAIARHRQMRKGKGFETVERYTDIGGLSFPDNCGIMLECMGNLLANEMFEANEPDPCEKIISGIKKLSACAGLIIIITNQVDSDGAEYSKETMLYIKNMGIINSSLAQISDCVIESVFGIPVSVKGGIPECLS